MRKPWQPALTALAALSLTVCAQAAHADERESLEALRQTTIGLIDALVDKGVLTREAADAMLKQARQGAPATASAAPGANKDTSATAQARPVQRVPYVSEAMKAQIRNEVKEEVLTQARAERWGVPNASPAWTDRIKIEGDFRYRHQADRPKGDNTPASVYQASVAGLGEGLMRSPEFATQDSNAVSKASTNADRDRERVRLRLGLTAKVTDEVGVGVRLATGTADDRVSTNQTLGNNFNKYQLFVDRAYARIEPVEWLMINAGRIPNPWFSTDMVWSENLNFDGVAVTTRKPSEPDEPLAPFATVGVFPLRDELAPLRSQRWLYGAQLGTSWQAAPRTRLKAGLAYYSYRNLEGREDTDYTVVGSTLVPGSSYGQYAYPQGSLGQKGNTLFETNPPGVTPVYGLAYKFRPVVLTVSAEFAHFSPYSLLATAELVKNTAFSQKDFLARAGSSYAGVDPGGSATGYLLRLGFGTPEVREQGQWLGTLTYKRVGSDAVVDAFTDSDMGLGGTNVQGYALGFTYGLYRNTNVGLRYLSSKSIDSPLNDYHPEAKYGVNSLQVDFNVRF